MKWNRKFAYIFIALYDIIIDHNDSQDELINRFVLHSFIDEFIIVFERIISLF